MAELAASIIGIGTAAGSAIKISKTIYKFCNDIKGAKHDIEAFARDVEEYGTVIRFAHLSLHGHLSSAGPQSPILDVMAARNVLVQVNRQADRVKVQIKRLMKQIGTLRDKHEWWTRVKWVLQKSEFKAVAPNMESVKSSLNLVVSVVMLQVRVQEQRSQVDVELQHSLREQIKQLKRQIRVQIRTIEYFREMELRRAPVERIHGENRPLVSPVYEMQSALVDIGDNMVRNESVPAVTPLSTPGGSTAASRGHSRSRDSINEVRTSTRTNSSAVLNPPQRAAQSAQRRRTTYPPSLTYSPLDTVAPNSSPAPKGPAINPQSEASSSAEPNQIRSEPIEPTSPISTRLTQNSEGDYIGIYASSPQIHVRHLTNYPRITGFITTFSGPINVSAALVPVMEECIISRAFALKLGLEIRRLDDVESHAVIMFPEGEGENERVGEQVRIEWTGVEPGSRAFRVRCLVSRRALPWKLGFGRPFVEKRRYYEMGGGSVV